MTTRLLLALAAGSLVFASGLAARTPPLDLSKSPLYLSGAVRPNVIVTFDDSASMEKATLPDSMGSEIVDNEGDVRGSRCPWRHPRAYAAATNRLYYDDAVTYEPPLRADGTRFPNANFNAAWLDGVSFHTDTTPRRQTQVIDLGTRYYPTWEIEFENYGGSPTDDQKVITHDAVRGIKYCDDSENVAPGGGPHPGNDETLTWTLPKMTGTSSAAFYYTFSGDPAIEAQVNDDTWYTLHSVADDRKQNFANWYSYYRARGLAMKSAASIPFASKARNLRVVWQNLNQNPIVPSTEFADFEATHKTDFFAWLFGTTFTAQTPLRAAQIRVGELLRRAGSDARSPYWDPQAGIELSCRPNYHVMLTDGNWNEVNPFPASTFPSSSDITGEGDRRNFDLPDGKRYDTSSNVTRVYWNERLPTENTSGERKQCVPNTGRVDPPSGTDDAYCDPTLADLAFHYWATDARDDLTDNVPIRIDDLSRVIDTSVPPPGSSEECLANRECYFNPKNDPASWQHLVNFYVTFGVAGSLTYPADYVRLRTGVPNWKQWPDARNQDRRATDDVWHAAVNSRGEFLSASNPQQLATHLGRFLEVVSKIQGSVSAATFSSGIAMAGARAYRSFFDLSTNTGDLRAYPFTLEGIGEEPTWSAAALLDARDPATRRILTAENPDGGGVAFRWSALPPTVRALLDGDGLGEERIDYVRGVRDAEASAGGPLRSRASVLGAIVNSSAVHVAEPASGYDDDRFPDGSPERLAAEDGDGFAEFAHEHADRPATLYVGANDAMMHAFDAATGAERFAYVPHEVLSALTDYSRPTVGFEPLVDSTPTVRDVFIGGRWRTVLVGTLRRGGQSVYALDITTPLVDEGDANATVLWEFSDAVDPRVGYTYQKANIVRLANGKWAAIVANGYNSEVDDGHASDGRTTIFILDLETGEPMRDPLVVDGSYGPTFVTTADYEGDYIDDAGWFGDLTGRVYRIDFASSDPRDWTVDLFFEPAGGTPLEGRPITAPVRLFPNRQGELMVLFGTGKLLERSDVFDRSMQAMYAVRDRGRGAPVARPDDLVENELTRHATGQDAYFTVETGTPDPDALGWRMEFPTEGERLINAPAALFTTGTAIVNTVIPNGGDPCRGSLRGSVYVIDAATGGYPGGGPLVDSNRDGTIDARDAANAIGLSVDPGIAEGTPTPVVGAGGGYAVLPEYEGIRLPGPTWRRRYWREVK